MKKNIITTKDFSEKLSKEIEAIKLVNKNKNEEYGVKEDYYHSFRLSEEYNFLSIKKTIFVRGILDKIGRLSSLAGKRNQNAVEGESNIESISDLINYGLLLYCYLKSEKENNYTSEFTLKEYNIILDYIIKLVGQKNSDYSKNEGQNNFYENFEAIERLKIGTVEEGILSRISIKISRIANFIATDDVSNKRMFEELLDFIVYLFILKIYISSNNINNNENKENKTNVEKNNIK